MNDTRSAATHAGRRAASHTVAAAGKWFHLIMLIYDAPHHDAACHRDDSWQAARFRAQVAPLESMAA